MRPLRRFGIGPGRIEIHHLAMEGRLLLRPQRFHGQHAFAHQLEAGGMAGAVIFHLVDIPAAADAEDEAAVRQHVEAGDGLGGDDGIMLRHQADAGADQQLLGRSRGEGQRHEGIVGVRIALGQFTAAGKGRAPAHGYVRVLGHEQRIEAALLERTRQLGDVDPVVGRKIENPYTHKSPPRMVAAYADSVGASK